MAFDKSQKRDFYFVIEIEISLYFFYCFYRFALFFYNILYT